MNPIGTSYEFFLEGVCKSRMRAQPSEVRWLSSPVLIDTSAFKNFEQPVRLVIKIDYLRGIHRILQVADLVPENGT